MKEILNAILKIFLGKTKLDEKVLEQAHKTNDKINSINEMDD